MKKFSPITTFFEGENLETAYNASYRPKCVNEGCNRLAHHVRRNGNGEIRYRPVCSECHRADMGEIPYKAGVTPRRKGVCENIGQYGFVCINKKFDVKRYQTDLHHKDHDPRNNDPSNIDELCKECHNEHHAQKGKGVYFAWQA